MYNPKYHLTHTILNNIIKFEVEKTIIEQQNVSSAQSTKMHERSKALNLLHLAHLIGINLTFKDAQKVAEGKRLQTQDARGIILTNYRNVIEFIRSNVAESYVDIDLNIMLHLNKIMLTDWRETWESRFRTAGEEAENIFDNWLDIRDKKIESSKIQEELVDLVNWYKGNTTKVHPLIRIAVFIYRLTRISPFMVLNKLSIIAISDYMFYKNGFYQTTFIPSSRNFDIYEEEYIESWNTALQGKFDNEKGIVEKNDDITLWIERFIRNISSDVVEVKGSLFKVINEEQKSVKQPFLDLNKRQLKILRYLQTIPTVRREDYIHMMNVSTMTAYRDLNELVKKRLLKVDGTGRGTRYMLANR